MKSIKKQGARVLAPIALASFASSRLARAAYVLCMCTVVRHPVCVYAVHIYAPVLSMSLVVCLQCMPTACAYV